MRKISIWANHHTRPARAIIIMIKFLLALMAFYTGHSLSEIDIYLSPLIVYFAVPVVFVTAIYYPNENTRISKTQLYPWRKTGDFILSLCSFISIATCTNNLDSVKSPVSHSLGNSRIKKTNPPTAKEILSSLAYREKNSLTWQEKRILKKEFNKQIKVYAKSKLMGDKDKSRKAGLIILTIIGALGLLFLLAALVCNLSCGGSDVAAVLVGLLGLGGIIWATTAVIKAIKRGPKEKNKIVPSQ